MRNTSLHVPVAAIDRAGVITTSDRDLVRIVELTPRPALSVDDALLGGLEELLGQLAPGEALQWYVESWPRSRADVLTAIAAADRDLVARQAPEPAAIERSTYIALREPCRRRLRRRRERERLLHRSLVRADAMRRILERLDMRPRLLDGPGASRLLLRRIHSAANPPLERPVEVIGALDPARQSEQAAAAATRLLDHLRGAAVDFGDERIVQIGGDLEQTVYVAGVPHEASVDWLRPLLSTVQPYVVSIHVRACENGKLELGIFQAIREPGPQSDPVRLATSVDSVVRESAAAGGARIDRGEFVQRALWGSTLPLALDSAGIAHRVDVGAAARSLPVTADECGSPGGIPFAYGARGLVERLDPWDVAHRCPGVVIAGGDARLRVALTVLVRLATSGEAVIVVDLGGELARTCADASVRVLDAASTADLLDVAESGAEDAITALDAAGAPDPLSVVGAAAALLPSGGTLVVAGAERLVDGPGGADWLRRAAITARRDGTCVIAVSTSLLPLARAGALSALPVRLVLRHAEGDAAELRDRLGLAASERDLLEDLDEDADAPAVLWLNGDRGRAFVHLIPLPKPVPVR